MTKFYIRDLFWLTAVIGLVIAVWIDRTSSPEVFYLHVYSTEVDRYYDTYYRDDNPAKSGAPVRIGSISVTPGIPFSVEMPNKYNPALNLEGKLLLRGDTFLGDLTIGVESPLTAFTNYHASPIRLEEPSPLFVGGHYHFVISRFLDPYASLPGSKPSVTSPP
ncbi:MAG: hypothetical protein ACKVP0_24320 [Pirellulaceae bacterium]